MVTADAQIRLHCIRSDQMYHHYMGEPLEVLHLYPDGTGEITIIGADLTAGMRPQLLIPGGTFHTSRLQSISAPAGFALLGTTEWPGVRIARSRTGGHNEAWSWPILPSAARSKNSPGLRAPIVSK